MELNESSSCSELHIVEETQIFAQVLFHFLQSSLLVVLVIEKCLLGIGMLSVILYLVIKQCNNPLTKEPKLN